VKELLTCDIDRRTHMSYGPRQRCSEGRPAQSGSHPTAPTCTTARGRRTPCPGLGHLQASGLSLSRPSSATQTVPTTNGPTGLDRDRRSSLDQRNARRRVRTISEAGRRCTSTGRSPSLLTGTRGERMPSNAQGSLTVQFSWIWEPSGADGATPWIAKATIVGIWRRLFNANFLAVKMAYDAQPVELEWAQAVLNLPSGLPLTGFLTPGGKLYFGGTYFPRETQGDKVEPRPPQTRLCRIQPRPCRRHVHKGAFAGDAV